MNTENAAIAINNNTYDQLSKVIEANISDKTKPKNEPTMKAELKVYRFKPKRRTIKTAKRVRMINKPDVPSFTYLTKP